MASSTVGEIRANVSEFLERLAPPPKALVLAAVSGGQDSICLLDALGTAVREASAQVVAVHINHRLRVQAAADAASVKSLVAELGYGYVSVEVDVRSYARKHRLGIEEAGRYARYQALATVAAEQGAWAAATGHTRDDVVETVLINIIRGTGPLGLTSIPAQQTYTRAALGPPLIEWNEPRAEAGTVLRVIRPLIEVSREQTELYCHEAGLPIRLDASNADSVFLRNRIRGHLLPLLRTYNPSIDSALLRLARIAADDEAELERVTAVAWTAHAQHAAGEVRFDWSAWQALAPAIQRRLLRRSRTELGAQRPWTFDSLEAARLLLARRAVRRRLALADIELMTTRGGFRLTRKYSGAGVGQTRG